MVNVIISGVLMLASVSGLNVLFSKDVRNASEAHQIAQSIQATGLYGTNLVKRIEACTPPDALREEINRKLNDNVREKLKDVRIYEYLEFYNRNFETLCGTEIRK